jgi:Domain of unknown function (DUF4062)
MGAAASARRWRSYPHPFFHYRQCSVLVSPTPQRMTLEASVRAYDCSPDPYLMTSPSSPAVSSRRMTKRLLTVPGLARSRPAMMLPVRVCWSETWAVESEHARPGNAGVPGHLVIRTPDRRLRVFVSSTLGELAEERRAVARAVSALRMTPVMFELGAARARLASPRATRRQWRRSAGAWRDCRWPSSWPPPGSGCSTRARCWLGWPGRWTRWGPARWTCPSGSALCGPRWSGASACSMSRSGPCWRPRRRSSTAGPSMPPRRSPGWTRSGRWSCPRHWPATASSSSTAPRWASGHGCLRRCAFSSPSGWPPGPTTPRSTAATPLTTARWPSRPTGRCGAVSATTSGSTGCRPRRATWPPP